jgi:hypothetical protein
MQLVPNTIGDVLFNKKPLEWLLFTSAPGLVVVGLVLWTLLSPRAGVVFSERYRGTI